MVVAHYSLVELAERIRLAIAEELRVSSAGLPFRVTDIHKQGSILTLELEPQDLRRSLDETMEDGRLVWKGETAGSAGYHLRAARNFVRKCTHDFRPAARKRRDRIH